MTIMDCHKKDLITTWEFYLQNNARKLTQILPILTAGISLFISLGTIGQIAPEYYYVQFTDKTNTPFTILQPEAFLSQRSIERRQKQGISIIERDLPVDPDYVNQIDLLPNVRVHYALKWMNGVVIQTTDTNSIDLIKQLSFVDTNSSVFILPQSSGKMQESKQNKFASEENTQNIIANVKDEYGFSFAQNTQIEVDYLHNLGYRGEGMRIAVIDAGFRGVDTVSVFEDLRNEGRLIAARDFAQGIDTIDYSYSDHGTNALGTISANSSNFLVGTAPRAEVVLIRTEVVAFEHIIEEYHWVAAAEFADSIGVDVCNTSLGYTTFDDERHSHTYQDLNGNSTVITRAANIAAETGMLIVNSAGNSGNDPWRYIGAPADGNNVLAVGAVNSEGTYVIFSSVGPNASGDVKPNVMAQGTEVATINSRNDVVWVSGTSFSGPIIAGAATCFWQANPTKTAVEIQQMIEASAHLYNDPNDFYGYGIPNFSEAHWPVGLDSKTLDNKSLIYPNPAHTLVYVPEQTGKAFQVYSVTGEKVKSGVIQNSSINVLDLDNGIYVLYINNTQQKLIIQR